MCFARKVSALRADRLPLYYTLDCLAVFCILELLENGHDMRLVSQDTFELCEEEQGKFLAPKGGLHAKRLSIITESTLISENSVDNDLEREDVSIEANLVPCASTDEAKMIDKRKGDENSTPARYNNDISGELTRESPLLVEDDSQEKIRDENVAMKRQAFVVSNGSSKSLVDVFSHKSEPRLDKLGSSNSLREAPDGLTNAEVRRHSESAECVGSDDDLPKLGAIHAQDLQKKSLVPSKSQENIGPRKFFDGVRRVKSPMGKQLSTRSLSERSLKAINMGKKADSMELKQHSLSITNSIDDYNDSDDETRRSDASRSSSTTSYSTVGSGYARAYKKVSYASPFSAIALFRKSRSSLPIFFLDFCQSMKSAFHLLF